MYFKAASWVAGALLVLAGLYGDASFRWFVLDIFAVFAVVWFLVNFVRNGVYSLGWAHFVALVFLAYAALSLLWSEDPRQGIFQLQGLAPLFVVFVAAPYLSVRALALLMAGGAVVLSIGLGPEAGFGNENFATEFILIALVLGFWRWRVLSLVIAVHAVIVLYYNPSSIELVVFAVLGLAFLVWFARERGWPGWLFLAIASTLGSLALMVQPSLRLSAVFRLESIVNTLAMWAQAPFFGNGFGSFNYFYPVYQEFHSRWFRGGAIELGPSGHIGAAHNEPIQLLAELGVVGAAIALVFLLLILRGWNTNALLALLVVGAIALVEFPLQNPHTAMLTALALGLLAGKGTRFYPRVKERIAVSVAVTAPVLVVAVVGWFSVVSHAHLAETRRLLLDGDPVAAFAHNMRAVSLSYDWQTRVQLPLTMRALLLTGDSVHLSPEAADQIHEVGSSASPWLPGLLIARLEYLLNAERRGAESDAIASYLDRLKYIQQASNAADLYWSRYDHLR